MARHERLCRGIRTGCVRWCTFSPLKIGLLVEPFCHFDFFLSLNYIVNCVQESPIQSFKLHGLHSPSAWPTAWQGAESTLKSLWHLRGAVWQLPTRNGLLLLRLVSRHLALFWIGMLHITPPYPIFVVSAGLAWETFWEVCWNDTERRLEGGSYEHGWCGWWRQCVPLPHCYEKFLGFYI